MIASDIFKSILCTILGATPGVILCIINQNPVFLVVSFLGGFVGFGLSLRSTSISRVARLGVAMTVQHNVPFSFGLTDRLLQSDSEDVNPLYAAAKADYQKLPRSEVIIDEKSARWMEGTTIDWRNSDGQEGFVFENPTWDSIAAEEMAAERARAETIAKSANLSNSAEEKSWVNLKMVGGIVVGALVILQIGLRIADNAERQAEQQVEQNSPVQALKNEEANWNEKIKGGEDVPDAILILANIEPEKYKKYQEALRKKQALKNGDRLGL